MLQIAKLLLSLSAWLPISQIIELVKAIGTLPNFGDSTAVSAWLTQIGITGPLAAVLQAFAAQFASKLVGDEPELSATDIEDIHEILCAENPQIDPLAIMAIIKAAIEALAMFRQWRQNRQNVNPAPTPTPTPVV